MSKATQYNFEDAKNEMLYCYGFCPPEPLFHQLASKFFDPRCPYFETGEREMLLDQIARHLLFECYPINAEMTDSFRAQFNAKLSEIVVKDNWHVREVL